MPRNASPWRRSAAAGRRTSGSRTCRARTRWPRSSRRRPCPCSRRAGRSCPCSPGARSRAPSWPWPSQTADCLPAAGADAAPAGCCSARVPMKGIAARPSPTAAARRHHPPPIAHDVLAMRRRCPLYADSAPRSVTRAPIIAPSGPDVPSDGVLRRTSSPALGRVSRGRTSGRRTRRPPTLDDSGRSRRARLLRWRGLAPRFGREVCGVAAVPVRYGLTQASATTPARRVTITWHPAEVSVMSQLFGAAAPCCRPQPWCSPCCTPPSSPRRRRSCRTSARTASATTTSSGTSTPRTTSRSTTTLSSSSISSASPATPRAPISTSAPS